MTCRGGGESASSIRVAKSKTGSERPTQTPTASQRQSSSAEGNAGGNANAKRADETPLQPSGETHGPSGWPRFADACTPPEPQLESEPEPEPTPQSESELEQQLSAAARACSARSRQQEGNSSVAICSRCATATAACSNFARMYLARSEGRTVAGGSTPCSIAHWIRSCSVWQQQFDQHSWAPPHEQAQPSQGKRSRDSNPSGADAKRSSIRRRSIIRGDGSTPIDVDRNAAIVTTTTSTRRLKMKRAGPKTCRRYITSDLSASNFVKCCARSHD